MISCVNNLVSCAFYFIVIRVLCDRDIPVIHSTTTSKFQVMKINLIILASATALIAMTACKTNNQVTVNNAGVVKTETLNQTEGAIHKVLFGTWTAANIGGTNVDGTDRPYIEFGDDATNPFLVKAYAYDGCNFLNGEYAVTPGGQMKRTSDFISTMRMCPDAKYEVGMNMALNNVTSYRIEKVGLEYLLYLNNAEGANMMVLRRFETSFINGAWAVTAINGASVDPDLDIVLVIDLDQQSIHGNAGCNTLNGKTVVNPDIQNSISFTNLLTTRMTCPAIATEQALLSALSTVVTVQPDGTDNTAVLRNANGNAAINLTRVNLK